MSVDTCLFCQLVQGGSLPHKDDGFVAIRDINPQAEIPHPDAPERHIETFRDIGELSAEESKRMLDFIAETAAQLHIEDYKVLCNVGPGRRADDLPPTLAPPERSEHEPAHAGGRSGGG